MKIIIISRTKLYFPINESIENLLVFVFSPLLVIVEDIEGIIGEVKEMLGEGRDWVGEGGEGWGTGGEIVEEEEKLEKSASSTNFWMLASSGYWCLLGPAPARRWGKGGSEGAWPGGGGKPRSRGPGRRPERLGGKKCEGGAPGRPPGGPPGGHPALIAFWRMSLWVRG
mgnify:CR=1 FL=1